MNIAEILQVTKNTLFSFELLPPLKGGNIETIYKTIDPLIEFNPININVTYHRQEVIYKKHDNGLLEPRTVRKRPGTVAISAAIKYKYKLRVVPHIICGGFTKEETENALIDLHFLGIHNLLVVRGDVPKNEKEFVPEPDGHVHAVDLVKQIMKMNKGKYIDEELLHSMATSFSVGVAGYPEKHSESPNLESDLYHLKQKVDAGADYIVTQMFFDNKKYFDFVKSCRNYGINVPIVPGLKPVSVKNHITLLPKTFNIDLPQELAMEIRKCKDNKDARQVGVEWAIEQSKELIAANVPALHFYTMGKSDNIRSIAKAVF
ncbi:MAG: methylenetetrahydrofolate reductase [NAD(P)H] [Chlorobi bacterium]|nr:methylenetetrahydrofolate reductase [NAD(P)H] [Chlorobiota bacterium]